MIIAKAFPHDSERLAEIQAGVYGQALFTILGVAFREYRRAKLLLGVTTEIDQEILPSFIDHRTLQWIHDALAAQYRYDYISNQDLFAPTQTQQEMDADFTRGWIAFIEREIHRIGERHLTTYRDICVAVFFPNPDRRGIEAEDRLYELTKQCLEKLTENGPTANTP